MSTGGWEQLDCNYFAETCRTVLTEYFTSLGFTEGQPFKGYELYFGGFDVHLSIGYDTNIYPDYTILSGLSVGEHSYRDVYVHHGIPMWYLLPPEHPSRTRIYWIFRTRDELVEILGKMKTEYLEAVVEPLLSDRAKLKQLRKSYGAEFYPDLEDN